jgi:hypothetical protein
MGDMNDIMHPNEKSGPGRPDRRRINAFCDHVKQCGFIDLGYNGPTYTWTNKCFTTEPTFQCLDRCLANAKWCTAYPRTTVYHLPMLLFSRFSILVGIKLTNLFILKIGGLWSSNMKQWPRAAGGNQLVDLSIKKPNILLSISGNGARRGLDLQTN